MITKVVLVLTAIICVGNTQNRNQKNHPDVGLNPKQIIEKYGYPFEVYSIETQDGYILQTHRIPYGKKSTRKPRLPVLLIPGILCTSSAFLTLGPGLSLGFILADEGYDVWIANTRGTRWSKRHKTLDPVKNAQQFFDFSFQELAIFDGTANIDFILNLTNQKKIFCIGHSQGTSTIFALAAAKPEYNKKLALIVALAPVAYFSNTQHAVISYARQHLKEIRLLAERRRVYEILPHSSTVASWASILCNDYASTQFLCAFILYFSGGYSPYLNTTMLPVIATDYPAGTSIRALYHYLQLANAGKFIMYDFGKTENVKRYGDVTPPIFNISKITAPIAMYHGAYDTLSTPPDVALLTSELPNVINLKFLNYSHNDFIWGKNVVPMLYNDVINIIRTHS